MYKCHLCDSSFIRRHNLKSHLLVHGEQRSVVVPDRGMIPPGENSETVTGPAVSAPSRSQTLDSGNLSAGMTSSSSRSRSNAERLASRDDFASSSAAQPSVLALDEDAISVSSAFEHFGPQIVIGNRRKRPRVGGSGFLMLQHSHPKTRRRKAQLGLEVPQSDSGLNKPWTELETELDTLPWELTFKST